ncbi:MAG: tail assembly chaperone [Synergistales bacterium]|nr:tail assembly chaperone [Synergistales bacterium]
MANTVNIAGSDFELKYPFEAVREISSKLNMSVGEILQSGVDFTDVNKMIVIIWGGLLYNNRKLTINTVSKWLDDAENYPEVVGVAVNAYVDSVASKLQLNKGDDDEDVDDSVKN